jgi:hypothetical protein
MVIRLCLLRRIFILGQFFYTLRIAGECAAVGIPNKSDGIFTILKTHTAAPILAICPFDPDPLPLLQ